MRVYRVEHEKTAEGPFSAWKTDDAYDYISASWDRRGMLIPPNPYSDGIDGYTTSTSHRCGTRSLRQLKMWFGDLQLRRKLRAMGYCLRVFEVPDHAVKIGRKWQVVFDVDHAKRIH